MFDKKDQQKYILCAELCELAYDLSLDFESAKSKALTLLQTTSDKFRWFDIKATSTQAFVISNSNAIFLVFQGSATPEDWIINGLFDLKGYLGGHAHKGFLYAVDQTFNEIFESVKTEYSINPQRPLIVSGHSLGGALAMLYAVRLFENEIKNIELVTFGQPRCGNLKFTESFSKFQIPYCRFTNKEDKVPDVPPPFGLSTWSHGGNGFVLSSDNTIQPVEKEKPEAVLKRIIEFLIGILNFFQNGKMDKEKLNTYISEIDHDMKIYKNRLKLAFEK